MRIRPVRSSARQARLLFVGRGLAVLLALSLTPLSAHAQIAGRLKKLAKDAAKNAASGGKDSATTKAAAAAGVSTSGSASGAAKIDISITADRLTMVLASLKSASQQAQAIATAEAEKRAYETKRDAVKSCVDKSSNAGAMPSQTNVAAAQKLIAGQQAMLKRHNDALAGTDMRKRVYLEDSLQVATYAATATMVGAMSKCGPMPYAPAAFLEVQAMKSAGGVDDDFRTLTVEEPALSAMTRHQFAMVRERAALYALGEAGLVPATKLGKEGVFTDEELAVLALHRDELVKMAPLFKSNALTWSGTSDLRGW
ncbi:MAG: hypothetical protein IT359_13485 [Gemmatimonadaceae bacterium]|nr:hypothetical protein [Gemmatimonadaceae bacterium]